MRAQALKSLHKNKLVHISMIPLVLFSIVFWGIVVRNRGDAGAAAAQCYGQSFTFTASAPSTVTPGASLSVNDITAHANTTGATVNSSTLEATISGATPSSTSKTWSGGPVTGDYDANYGDLSLDATGASGSTITVNITSVTSEIEIGGLPATITCSVGNGQLTANNPGESLELANIAIQAPVTTPAPSSGGSAPAQSTTTKTTAKTTGQAPAAAQPAAEATTPTGSPSATTQEVTGQNISITVKDHKGQPVKGAEVVLDSLPIVTTDSSGKATFKAVSAGKHNLSVTAAGRTVTRVVNLDAKLTGSVVGVQIQMPAPSTLKRNLVIVLVALLVGLAGFMTFLIKPGLLPTKLLRSKLSMPKPAPKPNLVTSDLPPVAGPQLISPESSMQGQPPTDLGDSGTGPPASKP